MTNPNDPAFNGLPGSGSPGLTKREYFAAAAIQGIISGALLTGMVQVSKTEELFQNIAKAAANSRRG